MIEAGNFLGFFVWIIGIIGFIYLSRIHSSEHAKRIEPAAPRESAERFRDSSNAFLPRRSWILLLFAAAPAALLLIFRGPLFAAACLAGAACSVAAGWLARKTTVRFDLLVVQASARGAREAFFTALDSRRAAAATVAAVGLTSLGLMFLYPVFAADTFENLDFFTGLLIAYALGALTMSLIVRFGSDAYAPESSVSRPVDPYGQGMQAYAAFTSAVSGAVIVGLHRGEFMMNYMALPFLTVAFGFLGSLFGAHRTKKGGKDDPGIATRATLLAHGVYCAGAAGSAILLLSKAGDLWGVVISLLAGQAVGAVLALIPWRSRKPHAASNPVEPPEPDSAEWRFLPDLSRAFESTGLSFLVVAAGLAVCFRAASFYGIAIAGVSMIAALGTTAGMAAYASTFERARSRMRSAKLSENLRHVLDKAEDFGRLPAAFGHGLATGSFPFISIGLAAAFLKISDMQISEVSLLNGSVFIGALSGAILPLLAASLTLPRSPHPLGSAPFADRSVILRAAFCAAPALLAPVLIGFGFGKEALSGMLAGTTLAGILLCYLLTKTGEGWAGRARENHSQNSLAAAESVRIGIALLDRTAPAVELLVKLAILAALVIAEIL